MLISVLFFLVIIININPSIDLISHVINSVYKEYKYDLKIRAFRKIIFRNRRIDAIILTP